CYLVVTKNNRLQIAQIIETEAYIGTDDQASHARFGITDRNRLMWGPPGVFYVYLIYGLHYLFNIICQPENEPAAVLIRALAPVSGIDGPLDGPAKLTKTLGITKAQNGLDITSAKDIFISAPRSPIPASSIVTSPRIGINYASEPWRSLPWRFRLSV
ncbi:MAG TPA: DNA-3-methyladenine glycosylase, partial [Patescibacteria group bacterium]